MWSLDRKANGEFYLVFDRNRRYSSQLRGVWEFVCKKDSEHAHKYISANQQAGYWVLPDDEGNMRMLILE